MDIVNPNFNPEKEEFLVRNYVHHSKDAILLLNIMEGILYANFACYEIFGYTPAELLDTPTLFQNILTPESRVEFDTIIQRYKTNRAVPTNPLAWRYKKKDGKIVHTETVFITLSQEARKDIGFQIVVRDITTTRHAERRNEVFIHLAERLSSAVTVQEAARIVVSAADTLFTWDSCTFDMYSAHKDTITSILNRDTINSERIDVAPTLTNVPPTQRMKLVIQEGGKLFARSDNKQDSTLISFGDVNRPSESTMIVPIRYNQVTVGLVSIQSYTPNAYTQDSLVVFQALADLCGGALERIRAREELQESENKYKSLFENVPDGVYRSTKDGKFITANKALADIFGYLSVEELLSVNHATELYLSPEDRKRFILQIERETILRNIEVQCKKKDGKIVIVLENAYAVRDENGQTLFYEGTLTDITELKNIEKALRESERKYRVLVERMNEGVLQVDNNDMIQFVNNRYCELVGYSREELIGQCANTLLHNEEGRAIVKQKNLMRKAGISDKYEIPLQKKSGEIITVLISGSPVYDDDGNTIGSIGIHLDITEQKRIDEELSKQKAFLRQVIDLDPNFIFAKDREGRFTLVNKAVADAYGTTVENLLGKTDADFNPSLKEVKHFRNHDLEVIELLREKFVPEEVITDSKGMTRWLQTIKRPLLAPDGKAYQVLGVSTDITLRKKAEEAFKESELRFRKIFQEGPIGMAIVGSDFNIIDVNEALCKMMGYSHEEILALSIEEFSHPDDYQKDYQLASKLVSGELQSYCLEKRYIRKDNSIIWGLLTVSIVRATDGKALYGIGIIEDITERKRTEEMLRLLESAVQQANESILITTAELDYPGPQIVFVNPAFSKMTGYSSQEVIGKTPRILQGAKTDRTILQQIRDQLTHGEEFHGETINYRKDGSEFFLEWHIAPIKNVEGKTTHYLSVQRDITARKTAEEALRKSEKRYRLFFEEDLTGDYIAQPDGTIIECNPAFRTMFGFSKDQSLNEINFNQLFKDEHTYKHFLDRINNERKLEYFEHELYRPDGTEVSVIQNVIGIFGKDGDFRRFKGYVFDNTERKKLEKHLQHSQRMESVGTLAAGLAHNFNNIMSIILGYAAAIKNGSSSPTKVAQYVDAISLAVKRGTGLVRQLTTFAHSSDPVLMSVNLNSLLEEMGRIVKETFPEVISCTLELAHDSVSVLADPNQLHQAFLNLCLNSRDAMPDGGRLTLKTSIVRGADLRQNNHDALDDRYVCVSIIDTGIGIEHGAREHLFEPFFTTKEIGKGTGLGLSVVYGIIKNHHGFIEVESEPTKGATFKLYFKTQAGIEKFVEEEEKNYTEVHGGPETILLVEDEEMLLELVKSLFESKGYKVFTAIDGQQAVDIYKQHSHEISLTLSDMGLPKIGGWDLLKTILEVNPKAKVLLASGYLDGNLRERLIQGGAVDFIQKPYDPEQLLHRIREIIDSGT